MKLACFDYDGVIADTLEHQLNILVQASTELAVGRKPLVEDLQNIENLAYEPMALRLGIPSSKIQSWVSLIHDNLKIESHDIFFPGMIDLLEKIQEIAKIVIITSNTRDAVHTAFTNHSVKIPFETYDGFMGLTKKERILNASKIFSIPLNLTYMIGDSRSDVRMGKEAGAQTNAVTWEYQSRKTLEQEKPAYFADSPEEIWGIIQE